MSDALIDLIESMGKHFPGSKSDPTATVAVLISETTKFRDRVIQESDQTLTVADTRAALNGLEAHLHGNPLPENLTPIQKTLAHVYIDRLTSFGY